MTAFIISTPVLLIAQGTASIGPSDIRSTMDAREHLDPYLRMVLEGDQEEMRVLVRFTDWPIEDDIRSAEGLGMEHICSMQVLPAALFNGTSEQITRLSRMHWVEWIEYDGELELLMEQSLLTINATVTWNSWLEGARMAFPQIDGEGVTVAVVDTGIDAGHPDLDYGEKTIINIKSDIPGGPWYELENSDTSYGHGTHCAGTIAGNGDASAGARSGVAPAAKLIGLCVGDVGITLTNTLQGLEWVYMNSKAPNPYNIKVISNSWGGVAAEYDPQDSTSIICQKLTYENNVMVVFAMGNAGSGYHTGETLTASPTGLIPSNIGVAATERDGSGVAYFSSRGEKGKNQTYPDICAPGVKIWSAHARATEISAMSKLRGNPNPYYLAISGTSMATPHISGLAALMFQAAPSLRVSDRFEDYSGDDPEGWYGNTFNRIHEIEWIMEQTAFYIHPDGVPLSDESTDNGVPEPEDTGPTEVGWDGKKMDWAQGYGLVDAEKCVGVALTLQHLRIAYPPANQWTVKDAIEVYYGNKVFGNSVHNLSTDTLQTAWTGEFARYAQDDEGPLLVQNQSRRVWVPEGATEITIVLSYDPVNLVDRSVGELTFVVDMNDDGTFDYEHPFLGSRTSGTKEAVLLVDPSDTGGYWAIGIYGRGFRIIRPIIDREFMELRIEYSIGVALRMVLPEGGIISVAPPIPTSMVSTWEEGTPSAGYTGGTISLSGTAFHLNRMHPIEETPPPGTERSMLWLVFLIIAIAVGLLVAVLYVRKRKKQAKG
jgi:serine protease AprX